MFSCVINGRSGDRGRYCFVSEVCSTWLVAEPEVRTSFCFLRGGVVFEIPVTYWLNVAVAPTEAMELSEATCDTFEVMFGDFFVKTAWEAVILKIELARSMQGIRRSEKTDPPPEIRVFELAEVVALTDEVESKVAMLIVCACQNFSAFCG